MCASLDASSFPDTSKIPSKKPQTTVNCGKDYKERKIYAAQPAELALPLCQVVGDLASVAANEICQEYTLCAGGNTSNTVVGDKSDKSGSTSNTSDVAINAADSVRVTLAVFVPVLLRLLLVQ